MPNNSKLITIFSSIGLLVTTIIWGFAFVIVKDSLDVIQPFYMMAFRFTIASIGLCLIFFKKLKGLNLRILKHGIILGLFLFSAYAFQTIGCKYTTASKNAFITTIYVVIVPFLTWLIVKKKPSFYAVIAAILAIIGIGLLSLQGDLSVNIGDILTAICGFAYAIHIVYISKYTETEDPIVLTVLQLVTVAIISWFCAFIFEGELPLEALKQNGILGSMLYLGLLSTMLAFLLQNVCQKYIPPALTALILSMESVFGVLFSCLILKEVLTLRMFFGCTLIFIAVLIAEKKPKGK